MATECPRCGLKLSSPTGPGEAHVGLGAAGECPSCGGPLQAPSDPWGGGAGLVRGYFRDVWHILTRPRRFFSRMPLAGGLSHPLAFALVTHWLGAAIAYLWYALVGGALGGFVASFSRIFGEVADVDSPGRSAQVLEMRDRLVHWIWGAGSVIADPFLTLAQVLFVSFLVFVGARLFVTPGKNGAPREITYESALRVVCFGLTPSILAALPLFGGLVASVYVMVVTVIAAREAYRVDTGRAIVVALFPKVLFIAMIGVGLMTLMLVFVKAITSMF